MAPEGSDELERLLALAEELQDRSDQASRQLWSLQLVNGLLFVLATTAIVVIGAFSSSAVGVRFGLSGYILVSAAALASLFRARVARPARMRLERDRRAEGEIVELLRETATATAKSQRWSVLEEAELRIRLARFDIGSTSHRHPTRNLTDSSTPFELISAIESVEWSELFSTSRTVDIVARFFDGVVQQHFASLSAFFAEGGRLSMVTVDPLNDQAIAVAMRQRNPHGVRSHPTDVRTRTLNTIRLVDNARREGGASEEALRITVIDAPPNYAAYCFDNHKFVMTVYEHYFRISSRFPHLSLDLDYAERIAIFWRNELDGFLRTGRQTTAKELLSGKA